MSLQMKGVKKITDLDKKGNSDDLMYRYKGNTFDVKFDKSDNALNVINKIQNDEISLADIKNTSKITNSSCASKSR